MADQDVIRFWITDHEDVILIPPRDDFNLSWERWRRVRATAWKTLYDAGLHLPVWTFWAAREVAVRDGLSDADRAPKAELFFAIRT